MSSGMSVMLVAVLSACKTKSRLEAWWLCALLLLHASECIHGIAASALAGILCNTFCLPRRQSPLRCTLYTG
jgi:hypothetical protein